MRNAGAAVLACAVFVAGCSTIRHAPPDAASLPTAFRNAAGGVELNRPTFKPDLGDPTLARLLTRAESEGLDAEAALARVRQARAVARQSDAARLPEVGANASVERRQSSGAPGVAFGPRQVTLISTGVEARWEADLFGRLSAEVRAARREERAARADLAAIRLVVAGDVARAYLRVRAAQARYALAERSAAAQVQLAQFAEARARAGLASDLDPARAVALAEQTAATARDLIVERETALGALAVLVGATSAEIGPEVGEAPLPVVPAPVVVGIPATLLVSRPDVARDLERLAAADDRTAARVRDQFPRLTLTASAGATSTSLGALTDPASRAYSVAAQLLGPILDFGRRRSAVDEARALADERAVELRATLLVAVREVEDALAEARERRIQTARLAVALDAQRRAVEIARARYTSGLEDLSPAIDAERTALGIEDASLVARVGELQALVSLWRATGGSAATAERVR